MTKENYSTQFYRKQLEELAIELKKHTKIARFWVAARLLLFVGIVALFYFAFPYNLLSTAAIVASIVLFLVFVRKSAENKEHIHFLKQLIEINENEIKASQHDFSSFADGAQYTNADHPFSYDMDVFGQRSFFQLFNRTVTPRGERTLVKRLLSGVESVAKDTDAVEELTQHQDWFQRFLAYGKVLEKEEVEEDVASIMTEEFKFPKWVKIERFVSPVVAVLLTALYYFDVINGVQFIVFILPLFLLVRQHLQTSNRLHKALSKINKRAGAMSRQIELIEQLSFQSDVLKEYQKELFGTDYNGKQGLKELTLLAKEAEYRDNVLVGVFLNFYFAWDARLLLKMDNWKKQYGAQVARWEEIVYDFEALISGANFRINYSEHTSKANLSSSVETPISLKGLGHPIIPLSKLVKNDFSLASTEQFAIVTGPNMAGKSTFLRSIGINLMLARAGFHVVAEEFTFPNVLLYSSMRTSDDLKEETSYFHAELLRLRFIMDAIEKGEKVFIILDEILKGTNSKDKEEGSSKFLQKLNQLAVKGIIATHDLSLTELANSYPSIINKYFDTEIQGDEISFDYTIRDGVAKNMNASFLLKKMGLIDN